MTRYPLLMVASMLGLLGHVCAWIPATGSHRPSTARSIARASAEHPHCRSRLRASGKGSEGNVQERPDLVEMKKSFERSMDGKLVMQYVTELRSRKALLLSRLEESGGIITKDIYPIMEELALVNPSSGCGVGDDQGKSHYGAMLPGNWIAASTIVPNVRYTYGKGESPPPGSSSPSSDNLDGRSTCTLEELSMAISGNECVGDYEPSSPVRPLRARISALNNTVKKGEMPTVVALAGFAPGDDEGGVGREEGAVRGRGIWGVKGANHLRWEFDTMNVDLGGDKILKTEASGGKKADAADSSEGAGHWGGRSVYEFFLDQNMLIVAWKGDLPKAEDAVVFVREEVPR